MEGLDSLKDSSHYETLCQIIKKSKGMFTLQVADIGEDVLIKYIDGELVPKNSER